MRSEDRRDLATATVGAGGVASGGLLRHAAVESMTKKPKIHLVGVLRNGSKAQRRVFAAGSLLGLGGTAPLAVGATRLATGRDVEKADDPKRSFLGEGIRGSAEALHGRGKAALQPVPKEVRATQLGIAAGAGFSGSAVARAALHGRAGVLKPVVAPLAGALTATGSIPLTNRTIAGRGYKVTPYGVTRAKTAPQRPSSKATTVDPRKGPLRAQVVPSDSRFSKSRGLITEMRARDLRLKITSRALFGQVQRGERLPMGEGRKLERVDAVLHGPKRAARAQASDRADAQRRLQLKGAVYRDRQRQGLPVDPPRHLVGKAQDYLGSRTSYPAQRAAVTLAGHPPVIGPFTSAATAGKFAPPGQERKHAVRQYTMGSALPAAVGVGGAYGGARLAEHSTGFEQRAGQLVGLKDKAEGRMRSAVGLKPRVGPGRVVSRLANTKAARPLLRSPAAAVGAAGGFLGAKMAAGAVLGQTAISLNQHDQTRYNRKHNITKGQTKREKHQLAERKRLNATLSVAGGTAGLTGLGLFALKHKGPATTASILSGGLGGTNALLGAKVQRQEARQVDPFAKRDEWQKQAPLKTSISEHDARTLVDRHGLKGPLPKGLSREQRRAAYEARYVSAGGHKAEKWQHRAVVADKVKTAGLAGATAGGAAWVGTRVKPLRMAGAALARHSPVLRRFPGSRIAHHAETAAGASAVVGGAGELYAAHARRKRSSYASAPGGVAASALRRMNDYTPGG